MDNRIIGSEGALKIHPHSMAQDGLARVWIFRSYDPSRRVEFSLPRRVCSRRPRVMLQIEMLP